MEVRSTYEATVTLTFKGNRPEADVKGWLKDLEHGLCETIQINSLKSLGVKKIETDADRAKPTLSRIKALLKITFPTCKYFVSYAQGIVIKKPNGQNISLEYDFENNNFKKWDRTANRYQDWKSYTMKIDLAEQDNPLFVDFVEKQYK